MRGSNQDIFYLKSVCDDADADADADNGDKVAMTKG
jgi:hypothetical protein